MHGAKGDIMVTDDTKATQAAMNVIAVRATTVA
jgi:hypothetical protein